MHTEMSTYSLSYADVADRTGYRSSCQFTRYYTFIPLEFLKYTVLHILTHNLINTIQCIEEYVYLVYTQNYVYPW